MSIEMMNGAWNVEGLTPTKKLILLLLGSYADENNQCYPSHRHIAKKIGLKDTKGIQRTIKEFEELGYLKIQHRKTIDGGYTSNKYTLLLVAMGKSTPTRAKEVKVRVSEPVNTKDDTKTYNHHDSESFLEFWNLYPRKVGRKTAQISFGRIDEKHYPKIIHAVKLFSTDNKDNDLKFIPHPTTWLNQERYMDYFFTDTKTGECKPRPRLVSNSKNNLAG